MAGRVEHNVGSATGIPSHRPVVGRSGWTCLAATSLTWN
ncbi:hypothetical protein FXB38_03230 [Bradyrhizobium cytisi]|uniref:Uncharacterized protein n=1 Tax=Bradyrhizobium cytisi TaxID=515489 RepID=A0A5S4X487_9BRAD|nr:hypothetical protein FXB38_03230 [Bradyrhizobium cytisi]